MENITIPECKIDTAKNKQQEHSAKKEGRRIDVLFFQPLHDHTKPVSKKNRKQRHEFILNKDGV